jgi:hypothetical protein
VWEVEGIFKRDIEDIICGLMPVSTADAVSAVRAYPDVGL